MRQARVIIGKKNRDQRSRVRDQRNNDLGWKYEDCFWLRGLTTAEDALEQGAFERRYGGGLVTAVVFLAT